MKKRAGGGEAMAPCSSDMTLRPRHRFRRRYLPLAAAVFTLATVFGFVAPSKATAVPGDTTALSDVVCPSAGNCVAVGFILAPSYNGSSSDGPIVATTSDDGAHWTTRPVPVGTGSLNAVSCPTTTTCFAAGENDFVDRPVPTIISSTDGGATWTQQLIQAGNDDNVFRITCPDVRTCLAIGQFDSWGTTDGGATWTMHGLPPNINSFGQPKTDGIACLSTSRCLAMGYRTQPDAQGNYFTDELITSDNGATWTEVPNPFPSSFAGPTDFSCTSSSVCVAVGITLVNNAEKPDSWSTADGGHSWTEHPMTGGGGGYQVSCPTATYCVTDEVSEWSSDGGTTWTEGSTPADEISTGAISCASTSNCMAVGWSIVTVTTDGGQTWSDSTIPPSVPSPSPPGWSGWAGPYYPPFPVGVAAGSAPAITSYQDGRVDMFVRGADNSLWHRWSTDGGSNWGSWENLGGVLTDSPAAISWGSNRIDVLVKGGDNQLWHKWWDGNSWSGWESLDGVLGSGPAVASWQSGRLDVFVRGTDSQIWHKWWDGSSWNGWEPRGGKVQFSPAAVSWGLGRIDLFAVGLDGRMWHQFFQGSWSGWYTELSWTFASAPGVSSWGPDRLDLFCAAAAPGRPLAHMWYDGTWHAESLGGQLGSAPGVTVPRPSTIDVFVQGTDNRLWRQYYA